MRHLATGVLVLGLLTGPGLAQGKSGSKGSKGGKPPSIGKPSGPPGKTVYTTSFSSPFGKINVSVVTTSGKGILGTGLTLKSGPPGTPTSQKPYAVAPPFQRPAPKSTTGPAPTAASKPPGPSSTAVAPITGGSSTVPATPGKPGLAPQPPSQIQVNDPVDNLISDSQAEPILASTAGSEPIEPPALNAIDPIPPPEVAFQEPQEVPEPISPSEFIELMFEQPGNIRLQLSVPRYGYFKGLVYSQGLVRMIGQIRVVGGIVAAGTDSSVTMQQGAMATSNPDAFLNRVRPPATRFRIVEWKEIGN